MVTSVNKPWLLNIPLSDRISTTLTTLEENRATEPKSIFTLSSSMSPSFLFGIIAALLEGYVQNIPLNYSINDLSVYINLFIDLVFLQFSQINTSILYQTQAPNFSTFSESGKISLKVFKMVYSLAKPSIPSVFLARSIFIQKSYSLLYGAELFAKKWKLLQTQKLQYLKDFIPSPPK